MDWSHLLFFDWTPKFWIGIGLDPSFWIGFGPPLFGPFRLEPQINFGLDSPNYALELYLVLNNIMDPGLESGFAWIGSPKFGLEATPRHEHALTCVTFDPCGTARYTCSAIQCCVSITIDGFSMSARDNQAAELRQEVLDTTRLLLEAVDKLEVANHA